MGVDITSPTADIKRKVIVQRKQETYLDIVIVGGNGTTETRKRIVLFKPHISIRFKVRRSAVTKLSSRI